MLIIRKFFAMLMAVIQTFLINTGIKKPDMRNAEVFPVSNETCNFTVPDSSQTDLYKSIEYASSLKNQVQCTYSDSKRDDYIMTNSQTVLTHKLTAVEKNATLKDRKGNVYLKDTFKSFYADKLGVRHYFESSYKNARVNTVRLGEYYYDVHVRDMKRGTLKIDKEYHVYSDKLYMEYALLADRAQKLPSKLGSEISVSADKVKALEIRDKNGVHNDVKNIDTASVEYAAFDIDGAGIVGFIVPSDTSAAGLEVKKGAKNYKVTLFADLSKYNGINKYDETGGYDNYRIPFGCRIYTDGAHSFDGIANEAYIERNPLKVTVTDDNAEAKVLGYEALRGAYTVEMLGIGFNYPYEHPDFRYYAKLSVEGDSKDRNIIVRTTTPNSGCLENAVILDKNNLLMPIDVEVCKNFMGDGGDNKYSYKDYCYGDTFTPIAVEGESRKEFTVVNLYQNWGNYPLKQLSSIEFHVSYYHLSTGTTESNCIAPYFVYDRDGWTLPDFRTGSGVLWETQPQQNSVGILKFVTYRDKGAKQPVVAEFAGSEIHSYGPTYASVTDRYVSDGGAFTYDVTHTEFPQNDENRTYYTVDINFTNDITFENFKKDFDLFYFDGRYVTFSKANYLNESNEAVTADVSSDVTYHTLGSEAPYMGFCGITDDKTVDHFGCNFALLIKNSKITVGGKERNIPFAFREHGDSKITEGCLTLDTENITFKKGDSIKLDMILLPWGSGAESDDSHVLKVREDSCLKPLIATDGENDGYVPTVKAQNNQAVITVKGGRGNNVIRADGFTSIKKPTVEIKTAGGWQNYDISSSCGYDGYMISTKKDGTYSISFVYKAENPDTEYTFRIEN